jgi:flagellar export protein FliJ
MSSFGFRLDRVLSLRRTQLALEETELARLLWELNRLEAALRDLHSRESAETEALQVSRLLRGVDLAGIAGARKWVVLERKRLQISLADCRGRIELKKASLIEAHRKVRLLERLKERRLAAWTHEQNRAIEELAAESALGSWRRDTAGQPVNGADQSAPAGPVQTDPQSTVRELPA